MKGTKYLSELVDVQIFEKSKLNIIKAPTGSGKTYFALNFIPSLAYNALYNVVYLIDTINGQEQILRNYTAVSQFWGWARDVESVDMWFEDDKHIVVLTYAKFGSLCDKYVDFQNNFDYIICDELHSAYHFSKIPPTPNYHTIALMQIRSAVNNDRTTVIALTATPDKIKEDQRMKWKEIPIDQEQLIHYSEDEKIYYSNLKTVFSGIGVTSIGLCYTCRITQMLDIQNLALQAGLSPVCIWSIKNENYTMTEEQLAVRDSILQEYKIPEAYNFLIINSSSETSIKIKSPVDYVIVNSTQNDTQIQVRGRVNSDIKTLYLLNDGTNEIAVPENFLDRKLYSEEKNQLCDYLKIKSKQRKQIKWTTLKELLRESGYTVEEKKDSRWYAIISE